MDNMNVNRFEMIRKEHLEKRKREARTIALVVLVVYFVVLLFVALLFFRFGELTLVCNHESHYPKTIHKKLGVQKEFNHALISGLHWYMENDTTLWNDTFKNTQEYQKIDNMVDWDEFHSFDKK